MNSTLKNRLKSLAWRTAMVAIAFIVDQIALNLGWFNLSPAMTTMAGLVLGEISKYLNTHK